MAKHGTKLTDEILDFSTVEDFSLIRDEYKQPQLVRFYCSVCNEPVVRTVERIQALVVYNKFNHLCRNCSRKQTSLLKYGVENPAQAQSVKDKNKETHLKNNNGEWMSQKQKEAITRAFKEKGQQIVEHRKQTCMKKLGVSNPNKTKEIRDKIKQTNLERRGVAWSLQAEDVKEKIRQTNLERRGVENAHQAQDVIQKTKNTCRQLYDSDSFLSSDFGKEKIKRTFQEKYGVSNPSQVREFQAKKTRKYFYEEVYFDSSWELALWIYARDHNEKIEREPTQLKYTVDDVDHFYYPDFRYNGKLIEIKGPHLYNENGEIRKGWKKDLTQDVLIKAKIDCAFKNNVEVWNQFKIQKYLNYVSEKYGKNYLQQFRTK